MAFSEKGYEILAQQIPPSPMSRCRFLLTKKLKPDKIFSRSRPCAESSCLFPLGCQEHLNQRVFQVVYLLEAFAELTDDKTQGWHLRGHCPYVNERVPILLTILYVKSLEQVPFIANPTSTKITHTIPKIFSVVTFAQLLLSTPSPKTATSQDPSRSLQYI